MNDIWANILSRIEQKCSGAEYAVWFKPLRAELSQDGSVLRVTAANDFIARQVRARFSGSIAAEAESVMGRPVRVAVESSPAVRKEYRPAAAEDLVMSVPGAPAILTARSPERPVFAMGQKPLPVFSARYSFQNFVVGPGNKLARAAAEAMLSRDAGTDILFMSSASGLGKTHLIQAIGNALGAGARDGGIRLAYLTSEDFTTRFVNASRFRAMDEFKASFRDLDVLLLEDVHFLNGKDKTQEELLATIKALQDRGGRVVLTSSFAPREIKGIDSQLLSHFCSGFIASIEKPDRETRFNILMEKARELAIGLPENVADLLAGQLNADVRMLESCLKNIRLKASLAQSPITEDLALEIIGSMARENPQLDLQSILALVCKAFEATPQMLRSPSRRKDLVTARNAAFYLLRKHTGMTLQEIGREFNRKHSTVINGITALEREMSRACATGRQLAKTVELIEKKATALVSA